MSWSLILANADKRPVGEILQAQDRSITLNLSKMDSTTFKVRLDNPLADTLMTTACYVKAYRDGVLQTFAPVIGAEEAFDKEGVPYVNVTASSPGWVFSKRYVGKSASGVTIPTGTDKAQVVTTLLDALNAESPTGVVPHLSPPASAGAALTADLTVGPYEKMLDLINRLANTLDGFDWRILPRENWIGGQFDGDGSVIGTFYAQPLIGELRPGAIFEWGTGSRANIASYNRVVNRESQATRVFHNVSEGPDAPGFPTVVGEDSVAQASWGLLEEIADADLHDPTLRQNLVDAHITIRKNPKQTFTFVPHIDPQITGRLPYYGTDYVIGDQVVARGQYAGVTRFNVIVRVYSVKFDLDNVSGIERATLTLLDEGS